MEDPAPPELNADQIRNVLVEFYRRVRADSELGPVFESAIGDWDAHMERITLFWLTAARLSTGYHGRDFMPAHLRHASISATQLPRWMRLFEAVCREELNDAAASRLIGIAERMAENLAISLRRRA